MVQALIGRWEEDLAIPIPPEVAEEVALQDGEEVELEVTEAGVIILRCRDSG